MDYVSVGLLAALTIIVVVNFYFSVIRGKSKKEIMTSIEKEALKHFLYAEKQGWTDEEKINWCTQRLMLVFPDQIKVFVAGPINEYVQKLYDEFKLTMHEQAKLLGIENK
jgi:hypothetical protein